MNNITMRKPESQPMPRYMWDKRYKVAKKIKEYTDSLTNNCIRLLQRMKEKP